MPACTTDASSGDTYARNTTYAGKWYDGSAWKAGQGKLSKEIVLNLKMNTTHDYNGNGDGNTFSVYLGPRNRNATSVCIASGWGACPVTPLSWSNIRMIPVSALVYGVVVRPVLMLTLPIRMNIPVIIPASMRRCFADGTRQEVGFKLGEQHQNVTYYQDYTIMRYADVLLMHSELNGNADD